MKKILMVILMASIMTPSFAFADNDKSERNSGNNSRKSAQMTQKIEKKEIKNEYKSVKNKENRIEIREVRSFKNDDHDDDSKRYRVATTTATTTIPIQITKKVNYYLCKTDTGWNVVPLEGVKSKNSFNALGKYCMKLPHGFAKKFNTPTASTTPDVIAPVISGISASSVTPTSAIVSWTTNEIANGKIYISTSTPTNLASSTTLGQVVFSTIHSFSISGLSPSTTYYYVVKSADSAGNVATSAQQSFVTTAVADTSSPVISSLTTSSVASTTATVSWNTDELATGKLWYGTSTPLTLYMQNTTLSLTHLFNIIGLTASTTYSLLIESIDNASNTATSTASFVTTN
ncbi:MAG: fibronectin type III domain-containing protein [Minisyncoccia bacterium]